jgi:ZIP family zinc transporter
MVATGSHDAPTARDFAFAFGLNIAAGLSTCIGGLIIFNKRLVSLTNPSSVGIALGLSAGVMIFISLVEIFGESVENFEKGFRGNETNNCDKTCKGHSRSLTTISFITGAAILFLLDFIVHKISPNTAHNLEKEELNALHQPQPRLDLENGLDAVKIQNLSNQQSNRKKEATQQALNRTGILTAVAIAIHNLPEGVTTFMAALTDTKLGVVLAISIALHNIPEGIAVATPIYSATRSRLKALFYTLISALAEPLGGVLCWLTIKFTVKDGLNPYLNGAMFGIVVGMMVTISVKELIPTALHFCPSKGKVTGSILIGMGIMALSLILFDYAGL